MVHPPSLRKRLGCALCDATFNKKTDLSNHIATHYDKAPKLLCGICDCTFENSSDLEFHRKLVEHYEHQGPPGETPKGALAFGPLCLEREYPYKGYLDLDKPRDDDSIVVMCYDDLTYDLRASTNANNDGFQCKNCKKQFKSQAQYNNHFLACTPAASPLKATPVARACSETLRAKPLNSELRSLSVLSKQKKAFIPKTQVSKPIPPQKVAPKADGHKLLQQHYAAPAPSGPSVATTGTHVCNTNGCTKSFRSEAGLTQHKKDVHGIGGRKLDLDGRDSWMLGSRRGNQPSTRASPPTVHKPNIPLEPNIPAAQNNKSAAHPAAIQVNTAICGITDIEQAKEIHRRALRLLIQSDISIRPDGIIVDGISWSRIACANQDQILGTLDTMCHLPRQLQDQYLPGAKTFKDEYEAYYNPADFTFLSARDPGKPGLGTVVIVCSKVALSDGRQEVVKVAAVDFTTGAILMNHLVCTDPKMPVADWRSNITGFSGWHDMEAARQAGYKVFKGWLGARAALKKYVDSETIIAGYNLRADLDILRITHGRAVDVVKVVEKAGNGPFSKQQLALDSLCRDTTTKIPGVHPKYGRNPLMDAFAVRELFLWAIKNQKSLETMAKKRCLEYQRIPAASRAIGGS